MNNLRVDHGEVSRTPGLVAVANPPTLPTVIGRQLATEDVIHVDEVDVSPNINPRYIVFTERTGYLGVPGSWSRINPRHATGTVSVTNGSPTVTGSGTLWKTRGIKGTDYFEGPDALLYEVASVDSETQVTLESNYTGGTAVGAAYAIERTFDLSGANPPFVVSIQGDLYACGLVSGGYVASVSTASDGGVIHIPGGADGAITSWTPVYVVSGRNAVEVGVDSLGYNWIPLGFGKLADGRLVMVGEFFNLATAISGARRVVYCDHTDYTNWTVSPAGSLDIEDLDGSIRGAIFYSDSVSIHLTDGIEIGELTGQDDPPLRLRPSRSTVGAIGPRWLAKFSGGAVIRGREIFLGRDLRPYVFNGLDSEPIPVPGIEREFSETNLSGPDEAEEVVSGFLFVDSYRSEAAFCFTFDDFGASDVQTREIRVSFLEGALWRARYAGEIHHAFVPKRYAFGASWNALSPATTGAVYATKTDTSWWWRSQEALSSDGFSESGASRGGVLLRVDHIDAGLPHKGKVTKEVLVFFRVNRQLSSSGSFSPVLTRYHDGDTTGEAGTLLAAVSCSQAAGSRPEAVAIFVFNEESWRTMSLRLSSPDGNAWPVTVTRMIVDYDVVDDVRST